MKDQYVADFNDFEKYAILRALGARAAYRSSSAGMLTAPDASGEGARTEYLREPGRYRDLEPHVFHRLERLVRSGERGVRAVEEAGVLAGARFYDRALKDHLTSRAVFFRDLWHTVGEPSLLVFDPDIGLAPKHFRKGSRRSAMYLFRDELAEGYHRGHSLVVYQHFPREQRPVFLARTFGDLRPACGAPGIFALWSSRVAFLVIPQEAWGAKTQSEKTQSERQRSVICRG